MDTGSEQSLLSNELNIKEFPQVEFDRFLSERHGLSKLPLQYKIIKNYSMVEPYPIFLENQEDFPNDDDDDDLRPENDNPNIKEQKENQNQLIAVKEQPEITCKEINKKNGDNYMKKSKDLPLNESEEENNNNNNDNNNINNKSNIDMEKNSTSIKNFSSKDEFNNQIIQNNLRTEKVLSCPDQDEIFNYEEKKELFKIFNLFTPREEKEIKYEHLIEEIENNIKIFRITCETKRKYEVDDILKKIKARFLKAFKNAINRILKQVNSKKTIAFFPECFVSCISKEKNKEILDMTIKELMSTNFYEKYYNNNNNVDDDINDIEILLNNDDDDDINDKEILLNKKRSRNLKNYQNNIELLEYLEKNEKIYKNSNFDVIENMTFRNAYEEFLESKEFEEDIINLIKTEKKKEKPEDLKKYIKLYITNAYNFINYFDE